MDLWSFDVPPLELVLRGTAMYWFLLLIFRFVLRRDAVGLGVPDILFVVLVADAAQNGMSSNYDSLAEGMTLVGTLVAWNYALDWAAFRWPLVHKLTEPPPKLLVDRGRVVARHLRQEYLTREDLDSMLRQAGVASTSEVRKAYLESDGKFSVLTWDKRKRAGEPPERDDPGAAG